MAKTNEHDKTGKAGNENQQGAGAGTGENKNTAGDQQNGETKTGPGDDKTGEQNNHSGAQMGNKHPAQVCVPVIFLPGPADEVCRHNSARRNIAFCTAVADNDTINLQAVPDGGSLQWRTSVKHQSVAGPQDDAWCHLDEEPVERN